MGNSYLAINQYERALNAYAEALRLKSSDVAALWGSGTAFYFQNRPDKVREVHASIARLDTPAGREFARKDCA